MTQDSAKNFVFPAITLPPVTRTDIVRYQGASGDMDAAHHDDAHAQMHGFKSAFSLGMLHAGQLSAFVVRAIPNAAITQFSTRFRGVVYPGDRLTLSGSVVDIKSTDSGASMNLKLQITNQIGEPIISGSATVLVP